MELDIEGSNSFSLDEAKIRIIQEMSFVVESKYLDCCPFLGDCKDENNPCNFPDYAEGCELKKQPLKKQSVGYIQIYGNKW